ncbi:MAG: menaquinone biosynthesis protein [Planctomycetaceae bacterium]
MPKSLNRPVQIGAVAYLNSKPLVEGLTELLPDAHISLDYPSCLADDLAAGQLDVGLVPSVECFRHPNYRVISDACVATHGPVLSVKLYSRVPAGEIQTLALDEGSRTSATLVKTILSEKYGVHPKTVPLPLGKSIHETNAQAILLIGDRAIEPPAESFVVTWDLGEVWHNWTGLPFVFALWVSNGTPENAEELCEMLNRARDLGVERIPEIAHREAKRLGIAEKTAYNYLTKNLHFRLGSAEQSGLKLFRELAYQLNPQENGGDVVFLDHANSR